MTLAGRIGRTRPRLGAVATVMSFVGVAGATVTMTLRVATGALVEVGVTAATFDALQADLEAGQSILMWLLWAGPVCPLAAILLGVGLLRTGESRRQAWLLVGGGVLLPMGQLLLIATDLTYSIALVLWAAALVPDGVRILRDSLGTSLDDPVSSPAVA